MKEYVSIDNEWFPNIPKGWQLTAGYNMGMTYVVKAKVLTNYSARNRYWYVRGTYYF